MIRSRPPFILKNLGELDNFFAFMMISAPKFVDRSGYFPWQTLDSVFHNLNENLRLMQHKFGEEKYAKLKEMSDQMRAYFEADPEDTTGDAWKGREIILEMTDIVKQVSRKRKRQSE